MRKIKLLFLIATTLASITSYAQNKPTFNPTYYIDSTGKLYWNKNLPAYIFLSPKPSTDSAVMLHSQKTKQYADPFFFDTEGVNYIRTHWAVDKKTKKTVPNVEILWEVYADGLPPYTKIALLDPNKYVAKNTIYCSPELQIKLSSSDRTSGVKKIFYSIDSKDFQTYSQPIKLNSAGQHNIKYFAVDNVNNVEKTKKIQFILDLNPPITKAVITGVHLGRDNIISTNTNIFLETNDDLSGVKKTFYRFDSLPWKPYTPNTKLYFAFLPDGNHTLQFYSVDNVNNKENIQQFSFYLDKTAPITIADVLGDKFIVNNKVYFSGRTKLKLTSVDNKSGVKAIYYSIDGQKFQRYTDPFYLPSVPGWHTVTYFAVDSTENVTIDKITKNYYQYRMKIDKIYVDLNGPSLTYNIVGAKFTRNDTVFISPKTRIYLKAYDPESGVKSIAYFIDEKAFEHPYNGPFTLADLPPGLHKITIVGYDNVNNRNIKPFEVFLDKNAPEILHNFDLMALGTKDSLPVYTQKTKLFLSFVDDYTGTGNIFYRLNNGKLQPYKNYITGFRKGKNSVYVEVFDKVGNKATKTIEFYIQ